MRVQQVFINLLSNATKFSQKKSIVLVNMRTEGENKVKISVTDYGIGIAFED